MDYFYTTLFIKRANCEILHAEAKKNDKKKGSVPKKIKYFVFARRFIIENDNNIPCGIKKAVQWPMFHLFLSIFALL